MAFKAAIRNHQLVTSRSVKTFFGKSYQIRKVRLYFLVGHSCHYHRTAAVSCDILQEHFLHEKSPNPRHRCCLFTKYDPTLFIPNHQCTGHSSVRNFRTHIQLFCYALQVFSRVLYRIVGPHERRTQVLLTDDPRSNYSIRCPHHCRMIDVHFLQMPYDW